MGVFYEYFGEKSSAPWRPHTVLNTSVFSGSRNPEDRLTFERQGMCAGASSGRDDSEQQESQEVPSSNRDSNDRQRLPSRNRGSNDQQELPSSNRGSNDRQRLPSNNRGSNDQQELPGSNRGSNDRHRGNNRHRGDRKGQRGSSDNGGFVACFRPCRRSFRPVCASNGVTYANRCIFNIAQCRYVAICNVYSWNQNWYFVCRTVKPVI